MYKFCNCPTPGVSFPNKKFVEAGIGGEPIWTKVRGQILLGEERFVEKFIPYLKGHEDIKEIPKSQRYIGRPSLAHLFEGKAVKDKGSRDRQIVKAVVKYGYSQKEVTDYLKMHYSTISRTMKNEITAKSKT